MVLDKIYEQYECIIEEQLKGTNTEEEIIELLENGTIHDIILKRMAKALTVMIYRNGKIEDVHAGEYDEAYGINGIPDSCMKMLNKDVCNRMYTMLKALLGDSEEDYAIALGNIAFGGAQSMEWDEPELEESLYNEKLAHYLD